MARTPYKDYNELPEDYVPTLEDKKRATDAIEEAARRGQQISDEGGVPLFTNVQGHTEEGTVYIPQKEMQTYGRSTIPPRKPTEEEIEFGNTIKEAEEVVKKFHPVYSQHPPQTPEEMDDYWKETKAIATQIVTAKQKSEARKQADAEKEIKISAVDNKKFSMLEKQLALQQKKLGETPNKGEYQMEYARLLQGIAQTKRDMKKLLDKYEKKVDTGKADTGKTVDIDGKQYKDGDVIEKDGKQFIVRVK